MESSTAENPRAKHERPDANVCPRCGTAGRLRELDRPVRFQNVTLGYDENGAVAAVGYETTWQVPDEGEPHGYECGECFWSWDTLTLLGYEQRLIGALQDHADHWRTRSERLGRLASGGLIGCELAGEKIGYADGAADAYDRAIAILRGNGEA